MSLVQTCERFHRIARYASTVTVVAEYVTGALAAIVAIVDFPVPANRFCTVTFVGVSAVRLVDRIFVTAKVFAISSLVAESPVLWVRYAVGVMRSKKDFGVSAMSTRRFEHRQTQQQQRHDEKPGHFGVTVDVLGHDSSSNG